MTNKDAQQVLFEKLVLAHLEPEPCLNPEYNAAVRNIARDKSIPQQLAAQRLVEGWRTDMENAPSGHYKKTASGKGEREVFVPEWCFIMHGGKRYWTYRTEGGRWNGLTKEQYGDCWHQAPTPPTPSEANHD